jgi:hypothetical protein
MNINMLNQNQNKNSLMQEKYSRYIPSNNYDSSKQRDNDLSDDK